MADESQQSLCHLEEIDEQKTRNSIWRQRIGLYEIEDLMEFTLYYRGPLKANRVAADKHKLRQVFHSQLRQLWAQQPLCQFQYLYNERPLAGSLDLVRPVASFQFVALVSECIHMVANLDITMLRPGAPGEIVTHGGDIDNRLKTLLDALKIPFEPNALPSNASPQQLEDPFFCLLEDDKLVTSLAVRTDRLLEPVQDQTEVVLLIRVITRQVTALIDTIGIA